MLFENDQLLDLNQYLPVAANRRRRLAKSDRWKFARILTDADTGAIDIRARRAWQLRHCPVVGRKNRSDWLCRKLVFDS
jgi:hypothetical protein